MRVHRNIDTEQAAVSDRALAGDTQTLGHPATRAFLSFSSAGHSFPDLARSRSNPCLFCEVPEMEEHFSISTCYLHSLPV